MWLQGIYVVTGYLCGYRVSMWLQGIYVVTGYLCGYRVSMWLQCIYVVTVYLCGYRVSMWLQGIYVVTGYLCGYRVYMWLQGIYMWLQGIDICGYSIFGSVLKKMSIYCFLSYWFISFVVSAYYRLAGRMCETSRTHV